MISIHALRKESDACLFLSVVVVLISIHALRKESDATSFTAAPTSPYFNPRSP